MGWMGRATATAIAVGSVALAWPGSAMAACPPGDPCPTLPVVDMERVVLAASLDPWRIDMVKTSGAGDDVREVEEALRAEGLLGAGAVDGYFGTSTTAAWGKWERRMGQDKLHTRNGLPSFSELQELGKGRFQVVKSVEVGTKVTLDSVAAGGNSNDGDDVVNERTRSMFLEAQRIMKAAGQTGWDMVITQGGYCGSSCASASAGTHSGGGAIDIRTWDTTSTGVQNRLSALRAVGFAAWYRGWSGNEHIHATAINDVQMSWEAHGDGTAPDPIFSSYGGNCQVYEWKFEFDGLGGCDDHRSSDSPNQRNITTWEEYLRKK